MIKKIIFLLIASITANCLSAQIPAGKCGMPYIISITDGETVITKKVMKQ